MENCVHVTHNKSRTSVCVQHDTSLQGGGVSYAAWSAFGGVAKVGSTYQLVCVCACASDLCLPTGGGGGRGVPLGLPQDQAAHPPTHPPKLTHLPTHPDPPLPPHRGGGGLCCYNQLVTQKPCVFAQKKFCYSVTMGSLNSGTTELAVPSGRALYWQTAKALVQPPLTAHRKTLPLFTTWTGNFGHFLTPFSIKVADPPSPTLLPPRGGVGTLGQIAQNQRNPPTHRPQTHPPTPPGGVGWDPP